MLSKNPFHVYWHNPTILVFKFDNLGSIAAKMWAEQCLKFNGRMPDPLRVLYDFVTCGPPSRYWIHNQNRVLRELIIPDNKRNAYLIPNDGYRVWTDAILTRIPFDVGPVQTFTCRDQAIAWLMEGL